MKKKYTRVYAGAAGVVLATAAGLACADAVDLTSLTTAIDFSSTTTAILGAGASLIVVYIAWKAAKMVIRAVKGL